MPPKPTVLRKIIREIKRPFRQKPKPIENHDPWVREIIATVAPFTITSKERVAALCASIEYIVRCQISGAIVECGVWRGGSMMAAALALMRLGDINRDLYLFDTFTEMPPAADVDRRTQDGKDGNRLLQDIGWESASMEEVRRNVGSSGYPRSHLHFIKGRIEETVPSEAPEQIALLRLDTDWYQSTLHELTHLYPRLSTRGILIIDDYGYFDGSRLATDRYILENKLPIFLHRIDAEGRMAIKT